MKLRNITKKGNITMPKQDDRHIGQRVDMFFPLNEYRDMMEAMGIVHMTNKSEFIRSAVHSFCKSLKEAQKKGAI